MMAPTTEQDRRMDDQTRRDLENIKRKAQQQRDRVRQMRLQREADEEAAQREDEREIDELRKMFGPAIERVMRDPIKFDIDPGVAADLVKASSLGKTAKVKRIANRHKKELKAASKQADKAGCLPVLVLLVGALPALAGVVVAVVHYL